MPPLEIILFSVTCLCAYYCVLRQISSVLVGDMLLLVFHAKMLQRLIDTGGRVVFLKQAWSLMLICLLLNL